MYESKHRFSFVSTAYPGNTFAVVSFSGQEGLSKLFEFDILLVSQHKNLDLQEIMDNPATLTLRPKAGLIPFGGILRNFQQLQHFGDYVFYHAVLVPKLWQLTLRQDNQVFLDKTLPQIMEMVLELGGLTRRDFELRLEHTYPRREFVCQYNESLYDFLARWMEHEGVYFFFEHGKEGTKAVFTDTRIAHVDLPQCKQAIYAPPSGLESSKNTKVVMSFHAECNRVPGAVQIKDFNYQTPSLNLLGRHHVQDNAPDSTYYFGEGATSSEEVRRLAAIRAEEHKAGQLLYRGESTVPQIRSGYTFTLAGHYRSDCNQTYCIVESRIQGTQAALLVPDIRGALGDATHRLEHVNQFVAIPASVQYRPPRITRKPRIHGTLNATIDAAGTGKYAELDEQGRYKVILPFDLSGRKDGQASCWLRMLQPYGGSNHGMHFPLHKGTEVLLTFIEGDPDRPVIAGTVPNPETPSQVVGQSQTMCKITTAGQNKIHIEDKQGSERILLQTPSANTWMRMGAPNDPPASADEGGDNKKRENESGFCYSTEGLWKNLIKGNYHLEVGGNSASMVVGGEESLVGGVHNKTVVGAATDITLGGVLGMTFAGAIEISAAGRLEINLDRKIEVRPQRLKTEEERIDIVAMHDTLSGMDTRIGNLSTRIVDTENDIVDTKVKLGQQSTRLTAFRTNLTNTETQLRQSINRVLNEELAIRDAALNVISNKIEMGEQDFQTVAESIQVGEKIFL